EVKRLGLPVQFHYLPLGGSSTFHRWPLNYLIYNRWHVRAARLVDSLLSTGQFQIVHLLNTVGYRLCGHSHKVAQKHGVEYVWGPIDGASLFPIAQARKYIGTKGACYYAFYNLCNLLQFRFSSSFRKALRNSRQVISATSDMQALLKKQHGLDSVRIAEVGCTHEDVSDHRSARQRLEISWSGLHIHRKALPVLLYALKRLPQQKRDQIRVHVLGSGPLTGNWKKLADHLGVGKGIVWHGWLPKDQAREIVRQTQIFCQTSFREVTSTVVAEALSLGVPVLSLKCCGMKDLLNDQIGWLVELDDDIDGRIATILDSALESPDTLEKKSQAAFQTAKYNTWEILADRVVGVYQSLSVFRNH
ncbi:MAG: glycosyltransferase, partial [Planctomycetaceae bacterium]|nr:glycosyltransferase [Planctomycetaceae bacterium]